jgi:hypothetical protein
VLYSCELHNPFRNFARKLMETTMTDKIDYLRKDVANCVMSERINIDIAIRHARVTIGEHRHRAWCKWWCAKYHAEAQLKELEAKLLLWLSYENTVKSGSCLEMLPVLDRVIEHFRPSFFTKYIAPLGAIFGSPYAAMGLSAYFADYHSMVELREICRAQ